MQQWERWSGKPFMHREAVQKLIQSKSAEMDAMLSGALDSSNNLMASGKALVFDVMNVEQKMRRDMELQGALDGMLQLSALELAREQGQNPEVQPLRAVDSHMPALNAEKCRGVSVWNSPLTSRH